MEKKNTTPSTPKNRRGKNCKCGCERSYLQKALTPQTERKKPKKTEKQIFVLKTKNKKTY